MYIGRSGLRYFQLFSKVTLASFPRSISSFFALKNREIISIRGKATVDFLQGLTTNDARLLESKSSLIFSLFLNPKGRVVSDTLIYRVTHEFTEEPLFMIECDSKCKPNLLKYLRFYNIRNKVKILEEPSIQVLASLKPSLDEVAFGSALFVGKDPRAVPGWSWRMLVSSDTPLHQNESITKSESLYKRVRYYLGLPEGAAEFKANGGLPLEANADICCGVSFSKGCYVGQELTARSRIGIVRKRVSPIVFDSPVDPNSVPVESRIYRISKLDNTVVGNRPVGWIRGIEDRDLDSQKPQIGLALLRIAECAEAIAKGDCLWVDVSGAAAPVSAGVVNGSVVDKIIHPFAPFWWEDSIAVGFPRICNPLSLT